MNESNMLNQEQTRILSLFETVTNEAELYYQKLERIRANIRRVESVFGEPERCQVCGDQEYCHGPNHARYTTFERYGVHEFVARVMVPNFQGRHEGGIVEGLEMKDGKLVARLYARGGERNYKSPSSLEDRYVIFLVEGGKIAEFIQDLAHHLTQQNIRLEWVQTLSERLRPR